MAKEYKSLITNVIAGGITLLGYAIPKYGPLITTAGFFALSGALTNWLAVYMLFERVPLLYGSGVVPLHFEEFKLGIKHLIMQQFFTATSIKRFFGTGALQTATSPPVEHIIASIDFDHIFQNLVQTIMTSKFIGVLSMFGGEKALDHLKEPIIQKLQALIYEILESDQFKEACIREGLSEEVHQTIETMVDERLSALTPNMVKNIVEDMIQKHLGWLVVWGGVFGGLIGIILEMVKLVYPA